nr:MAG TPA: hypothetical protein [Caudoviricetes sp.]
MLRVPQNYKKTSFKIIYYPICVDKHCHKCYTITKSITRR